MAREQFTLEILADIQNAETPIQKIVQLLRIFDEAQIIDVAAAPTVDAAIAKIRSLSNAVTNSREESNKLFTEFRSASSGLKFGSVTTDQAKALADQFTNSTERFKEFRSAVKAGAKEVGIDPNTLNGFQTFDQALTQVQGKIGALKRNVAEFGFTDKTVLQIQQIDQLVAQLSSRFPGLKAVVQQQLIDPANQAGVAIQALKRNIDAISTSEVFQKLQGETTGLSRRVRDLNNDVKDFNATGILSDKSLANFNKATEKANILEQKLNDLKAARAQTNLLGLDPGQIASIDSKIASIETRLASIRSSISNNAEAAKIWESTSAGIITSYNVIEKLQRQLTAAQVDNNRRLNEAVGQQQQIATEIARIRQIESQRTLTTAEANKLDGLLSKYDQIKESVRALGAEQKSLTLGRFAEDAVGQLDRLRASIETSKTITTELREKFKELTGQTLPADNANAYATAMQRLQSITREIAKSIPQVTQEAERLSAANFRNGEAFARMKSEIKDFNFYMTIAVEKIIRYRIAFSALQKSVQAIQSTFTITRDIESQFAQIEKVSLNTSINMEKLKNEAFNLGKEFGRSIKDVSDIMSVWAQQGKTQNEILALTKYTLFGVVGANLEAEQAVETLTAAQKIYNLTADESLIVFDKLLNVQRLYAVTTKDLADSIKLLGVTADEFGVNMDNLLAQVTAVVQVTRKTGQQVANSLKTIFAKFIQSDSIAALRDIGVAVFDVQGELRPLDETLGELSSKWDALSASQRLNIARLLGGIRHYTQFLVLMEQYSTALKVAADSQNSAGYAVQSTGVELETLANQLERIKVILTGVAENFGSAFFGLANQAGAVANIIETIDKGTDADSLGLKVVTETIAGLGVLAQSLFIVAGAKFLLGISSAKWADVMTARVIPALVVVGSTSEKVNQALAKHGVLAADSTLIAAGALDHEFRAIAKAAAGLQGLETVTKRVRGENYTFALGLEVNASSLDNQTRAAILSGRALSALGQQAAATSAQITGAAGAARTFVGVLGGPWGIAFTLALTAATALGIALNNRKKDFEALSTQMEINITDAIGYAENINKLAGTLTNATVSAEKYFQVLNDPTANEEKKAKAIAGISAEVSKLRNFGNLGSFDVGRLVSTDQEERLKAQAELQEQLIGLVGEYGNEALRAERIAVESYTKQLDELKTYRATLHGLTPAQEELTKALKTTYKFATDELQVKIAEQYRQEIEKIDQELLKLRDNYEEIEAAGNTWGRSARRLEDEIAKKQIERDTINIRYLELLEQQKGQFVELENAAKAFVDQVLATENKNLIETLFGDAGATKDVENIADDLVKTIQDRFKTTGAFNMRDLFKEVEVIAFLDNAAGALNTTIQDTFIKMEKMEEAIAGFNKAAEAALTFTPEELEKLRDRVSKFSATASIAVQDLGKTIAKTIRESAAANTGQTYFDIVISKNQDALKSIDAVTEALALQIRQQEIQNRVKQDLAAADLLYNQVKLTEAVEKQAELEQKISRSGYTEEQIRNSKELRDKWHDVILEIDQARQSVSFYGNIVNLADPDVNSYEQIVKLIDQAVKDKRLEFSAGERIKAQNKQATEYVDLRLKQLKEELALVEKEEGGKAAALRADIERYQIGKLILDSEKERAGLAAENAKKDIGILNEIFSALDRSTTAISKSIEQQNIVFQQRAELAEAVTAATARGNNENFKTADLIRDILTTTITWEELVNRVRQAYVGQNEVLEIELGKLQRAKEFLDEKYKLSTQRLRQELLVARAIEQHNIGLARTESLSSIINDIRSEINSSLNDTEAALNYEEAALRASLELHKEIEAAIISAADAASTLGDDQAAAVQALRQNLGLLNKEFETTVSLLGIEFSRSLQKIQPFMVDIRSIASDVSDSFASAFVGINESLVGKFEEIAEKELEIKEQTDNIKFLNEELSKIIDRESDQYKNITKQISEAGIELQNMKRELDDISNVGKVVETVFGNFANTISDLVISIQTDALKSALENALLNTSIGKTIANAFLTGSQKAANEIAVKLAAGLTIAQKLTDEAALLAATNLGQGLIAAITDGTNIMVPALKQVFDGFIGDWAAMNQIEVPENALPEIRAGFTVDDIRGLSDKLDEQTTKLGGDANEQAKVVVDELNKIATRLNAQIEESSELNAGMTLLRAAIPTIARDIGTILATQAFGANAAGAASTGGGIGNLVGNLFAATNDTGNNLLGKLFGAGAEKFAASTLGSILLPGLGTIAGSLIGGLFGGDDQVEKIRAPLVDLSSETKANTEAIRTLNSTFDDLRSELINAPSRFVIPPQATLGGRVEGGGASGIGGPIGDAGLSGGGGAGLTVNFNVNGGFDQAAANQAVQQIAGLYDRQRRTGGGNKILRR